MVKFRAEFDSQSSYPIREIQFCKKGIMKDNQNRRIAVFGATGSIGTQTLDVINQLGGFDITVLTAGSKWQSLAELALKWKPRCVAIGDPSKKNELKNAIFGSGIKVYAGKDADAHVAESEEYDLCLNGLVGVAGLMPSYHALSRGIDLALANKESLVLAGDLLNSIAKKTNSKILPVDSEHSAILQCLQGEQKSEVRRLILTASGGPFRKWPLEKIRNATKEAALNHPTWSMGPKITIDSATLMNKGLEIIEAYHLFKIPIEKIDVRIHPVSVVHSMVEFVDGSFKAQLGVPDMRIPIEHALFFPTHREMKLRDDDPADWPPLEFSKVEDGRYPCLDLAYKALSIGGTATAVLNGADEAAVAGFLNGRLKFGEISETIEKTLDTHNVAEADNIEEIKSADSWGRDYTETLISELR